MTSRRKQGIHAHPNPLHCPSNEGRKVSIRERWLQANDLINRIEKRQSKRKIAR
jgi:hypothetical protein